MQVHCRFNSLQVESKGYNKYAYPAYEQMCFNSLQVESKEKFSIFLKLCYSGFNSLQVESKVRHAGQRPCVGFGVSIPYRQSQKYHNIVNYISKNVFQFLIGRVKSLNRINKYNRGIRFQFLIGRVKRGYHKLKISFDRIVSIPYRQSQKMSIPVVFFLMIISFNSLQVESKALLGRVALQPPWRFQFLIGRVKRVPRGYKKPRE